MQKPRVLFLCTGNSARSQMAEGLLRHYDGDYLDVYSAGLEPKGINPYTVRAMQEIGVDISSQYSKSVREYLGHMIFTYVITVCDHAEEHCPTAFLTDAQIKHLHWSFEDPAALEGTDDEKMAKFREVRDQIDAKIKVWSAELIRA